MPRRLRLPWRQPKASTPQTAPKATQAPDFLEEAPETRRLAKDQARRQARLRRNRSRALTFTVLILLTVVLSLGVVRLLLQTGSGRSGLRFVTYGTLYRAIDGQALLIRSESLYLAESEGTVYPEAAEAQQVGYGQKIALLSTQDVSQRQVQLRDLKAQLASRQIELLSQGLGEGEGASEAFSVADEAFRSSAAVMAQAALEGNLLMIDQEDIRVQKAIDQRNSKLNRLRFDDPLLATLRDRINRLEHDLEQASQIIYSKAAGLVTYSSDGLETELEYDKVNQLTADKIAAAFAAPNLMESTLGLRQAGQAVARLVSGLNQYVVFDVPESALTTFEGQTQVGLFFPNQGVTAEACPVLFRLRHKSGIYLFVQMDSQLDKFLRERRVQTQLRTDAERGLIVPTSALRYPDAESDLAQLVAVRSGAAHLLNVRIRIKNQDQSLIELIDPDESLQAGSLVVENPGDIQEGDKLEE